MITQIKHWLQKLFAWWPWREESPAAYAPTEHHFNTGTGADSFPRPIVDGTVSQPDMAPQIGSQGEPRYSTIEGRRAADLDASPPSASKNDWNREALPSLPPALAESGRENLPARAPAQAETPAPRSTAEQHLEFLRYLVRRGIVNEGFTPDDTPEQYKNK